MKVLFIGDVFGKAGRGIMRKELPRLIKKKKADLVIANVENICHGKGVRIVDIDEMKELGVHVFTGGNHTFSNKDIFKALDEDPVLLRPANYPDKVPGKGYTIFNNVLVINLLGRVFIKEDIESPFTCVDEILKKHHGKQFDAIIVDFHAEATSEKRALYYYLDGKVSAVLGTHTHVQTADEEVSSKGTAFISDAGMTGPTDSIIGMDKDLVLEKFLTSMPVSFKPAEGKPVLNAVLIDIKNGKAKSIERIFIRE